MSPIQVGIPEVLFAGMLVCQNQAGYSTPVKFHELEMILYVKPVTYNERGLVGERCREV